MQKKSFTWLILVALIVCFSACKKNGLTLSSNIDSVPLYHCTNESASPYICFDSLLMDSRCPIEAVCFWQGTALIKVSFHEATKTQSFIMSLKGFPGLGYASDTTISGYTITFNGLKPYPSINNPDDESPKASFSLIH